MNTFHTLKDLLDHPEGMAMTAQPANQDPQVLLEAPEKTDIMALLVHQVRIISFTLMIK